MNRTITVKGTGNITLRPDQVVIPVTLVVTDLDYTEVMRRSTEALDAVCAALETAGFRREDVKTLDLSVNTRYDGVHEDGVYKQVFAGYECRHSLKLAFDLDQERLGETITALAGCEAKPEFSIRFTVKDQEAAKNTMLRSAAADARRKAETLCAAAGVTLGALSSILYDWKDVNLYSQSNLMLADAAPAAGMMKRMAIEPEDVTASDTVTFLWEIV